MLPLRIGDAHGILDLVPVTVDSTAVGKEKMVLAAYGVSGALGFRMRRQREAEIRAEVAAALHEVRPRTVVMVFEGISGTPRSRVDRISRRVTREVSVDATNMVGSYTTVIGLVVMSPEERALAATCVRHVASDPPESGDGLVFHAADLRRANIFAHRGGRELTDASPPKGLRRSLI
jgi:hypothetical protein